MPDDTHVDDKARKRRTSDRDTFRPTHTDDRFRRTVRDDHAPNAALHSALRAVVDEDPRTTVSLMASHAPGERDHEPRYHVRVTLENHGAGEPSTGTTVLDDMVERDDVVITKAYGGARFDDVTVHDDTGRGNDATPDDVVDAVESTIDQSVDRLTVHLRPVQTRVEPVEVRVDDIPDDFIHRRDVGQVLVGLYDDITDGETTSPAVESIADQIRQLAVERFDAPVEWKAPEDDRVDVPEGFEDVDDWSQDDFDDFAEAFDGEADDALDAVRHGLYTASHLPGDPYAGFPFTEVGREPPTGRPPVEPIREWVDENRVVFDTPGTLTDDGVDAIAEMIADAIAEHEAGFDGASQAEVDAAFDDPDYDVDDRAARIRVTVDGEEHTDVVRAKERFPDLPDDVEVYVDGVEAHDTDFPKTRPAEAAVRSYVERRLPDAAEDVDADVIADMVENFALSGSVWGENAVFEYDDPDDFDPDEAVDRWEADGDDGGATDE